MIKDSGERREFSSGAVRDVAEGKGRCDLLPLGIVEELLATGDDPCRELWNLEQYVFSSLEGMSAYDRILCLRGAIRQFCISRDWDMTTAILEVSKHFEEGAKKYKERNWEQGIPTHCYLDSAIRHWLKWKRGDTDEPHDRAFLWNLLCLMWTIKNKPEFDDMKGEKNGG